MTVVGLELTVADFRLLARANVALAVSLAAISSALALATTPLLAALGFELALGPTSAIHFPLAKGILQIAIGLVLPIALGMSIRQFATVCHAGARIGVLCS
jgi:BASS family bile acid:Na+ symporter